MVNLKNKRNKLALIEEIIENEKFGLYNIGKSIDFIMPELSKIKKLLLKKSNEKTNYEKEFYYKLCIKINLDNYLEYFKILDQHIEKKRRQNKTIVTEEYTFEPRKTAEITVGTNEISNTLRVKLKKYIYLQSSSPSMVTIYLRTKKEYNENISELKEINNMLKSLNIKFSIKIIGESEIIKNMNPKEKKEFIDFLRDY